MRTFDALLASMKEGRYVHAYMLIGLQGSGKKDLAIKMACALLGQSENHPDLVLIKPEKGFISVDQIREIRGILTIRAVKAAIRVVIIEQANLMNERAQNAFLKTLEEPEAAVFILLSETETGILPTIRSRCLLLKMPICSREEIATRLIALDIARDKADLCASLARGAWGNALQWAKDEARFALRRSTIEGMRRLFSRKTEDKNAFAELLKANKENVQMMLDVMLSVFRDMALDSSEGRINLDCIQMCEKGSRNFSKRKIAAMIHRIMRAQREFASNVNFALAVDALLIDLTEDVS
ncbi:MAG: DNA polymerase III subunit [Christensenellales bacterium]